ncbi:MAG: hypothetical protein Q8936_19070 [Bacillota bacterium]|nr:hypothetical protein [Bacillota bacterium]
MYVVASFEHSFHLELAIVELEEKGIKKENIFAIPLIPKLGQAQIFDTIHRSDGISLIDGTAISGAFFAVLGATYGYILKWGPIIWGLIGLGIGFALGFLFEIIVNRKKLYRKKRNKETTEVVVMVKCYESQAGSVEKVLYDYLAFGVAKLNHN